ncbi:MAG: hypothetical protein J6Q52_04955 [Clostridia bacterium]|nr:hypothetical protein [Clostridia bacterium]
MHANTLCLIALILSISITLASTVMALVKRKNRLNLKPYSLKPLWTMVIGVFVAGVVMFLPTYLLDYFATIDLVVVIDSVILSLHNAIRMFVIDIDFEPIAQLMANTEVDSTIASVYSIYASISYVLAPILSAGVVLSFFKNASAMLRYLLHSPANFYYMTQLNEKSLALAENILKDTDNVVIFTSINDNSDEDMVYRAKSLGAICLYVDIADMYIKTPTLDHVSTIYFISLDEDKNLEQALTMLKKANVDKRLDHPNYQMYVFCRSVESGIILDNAPNSNIRLRRINEERNLAYRIVQSHSIFDDAIVDADIKRINLLVVSETNHNTNLSMELVKTLSWCTQMPGYDVKIHVADMSGNFEDLLRISSPELISLNHKHIEGDAKVDIYFYQKPNLRELASTIGEVSTVYTMLEDDEANINSAIILREEFGKLHLSKSIAIPTIFATVRSPEKNETISSNGSLKDHKGNDYGITLIGNIASEYSVEVVEQIDLETKGLKCHLRWSNTLGEVESNTLLYNEYEYYRRASISEALYSELRIALGILLTDDSQSRELLKMYEHMRWNAYMRTEGYVYGAIRDEIAKTHPSLVPYQALSHAEKQKDEEVLLASEVD